MNSETKNEKRKTSSTERKSFQQTLIWQKAKQVAIHVYAYTRQLPESERYGIASQMQRAAISISSNIAEGYNRFQKREKRQFLVVAYGSAGELESQLLIAKELYPQIPVELVSGALDEASRMLNSIIVTRF